MIRILIIIFILLPNILFSGEIVFESNTATDGFHGEVLNINHKDNTVILKNFKSNTEKIFKLDNNQIIQLKKGDKIYIKSADDNNGKQAGCKCRSIRERIKKLVRKRRNIHKLRKNFNGHHMFHGGKK